MNPDAEISDDDDFKDFEKDLKATQQQMKQKAAFDPLASGNNQDDQEVFEEHATKNSAALAHQKYNTDNLNGGLSDKKKKKKKKKPK